MKWLRLLLRVLLAIAILVGLAVFMLVGPLRQRTIDLTRPRLEQLLSDVLHEPVTIGEMHVSLLPLRVEAEGVSIGADGALARSGHLTVRVLPRTSLRQMRPVADAVVDDVFVDVPRWIEFADRRPHGKGPSPVQPFWLHDVRVQRAWVRLSDEPDALAVKAETVVGEFEADFFGRLQFGGEAQQLELSRQGAALLLTRAHGRGGETTDGWRLSEAEVVGDGVQLSSAEAAGDRLPIRGRVALPRLAFASPVFARLGGEADIDAALVGRLDKPAASGTVRVDNFTADGERVGDVSATVDWNLQRLTVATARLQDGDGVVEASGRLAMRTPFAYDAKVTWSALDPHRIAALPEQTIKPFTANGEASASGELQPLALRAEGSGRFNAKAGGDAIDWSGSGNYRNGTGGGQIEAAQANANTLRATIDVASRGVLSGALKADVANPAALGAFLPIENVPNLTGALSASAQVSGTTTDPRLDGQLGGREIVLLGVGFDKLGGTFTLDRTAFRTPGITADLWQGSLAFSGTVALDSATANDWSLRAIDVPGDAVVAALFASTGTLLPIGRGTLVAELKAHGPWSRVDMSANAEMQNFWLTREWVQRAAVQGSAQWPRWQLTGEVRNRADQTVVLRGSGTGVDDVNVELHSGGWELTALQRGALSETGGVLLVDASLHGPLRALSGRAVLQARELVLGGRTLGNSEVEAVATRGRWEATTVLLGGAVQVRAGLLPDPGWPVTVDAQWADADFGPLLAPDSDVHVTSSGTLQTRFRLAAVDQFDATVNVPALQITNGPYVLSLAQAALLDCRRGACTINELTLRGTNTELRIGGRLSIGGAVALRMNGKGDLRLLELLDAIESARGNFSVDAELDRSGGHWNLSGQLRLDQAALDLGGPVAITRASGRLSLAGTTVRIDELRGRMGTGTFAVGGDIDLSRGPDLTWTLDAVGADLMPSLEAELSGRGSFAGTWEHMRLSGEIDIARMLYDRDIELTDFLPSINRVLEEAPRRESARRFDLELHIVAPGELYIENNVARVEARADVRVSGTAQRPVLAGRIEALDGTITFRDREFELQGGTIDFRPDLGLTAGLNISAESTIDTPDATYTVDVRVTGTTNEPRVTMTSDDPSLSQTDIATLIAVGKTTAQMREGGGGFSVYDALAAVPGTLSRPVTQGTKQLLPIDRISFESTYSRTTGTFEPQLKLGKDLTDALAVSVGQTFGVESRTSVSADYRLTPTIYIPLTWETQTSAQEGAFGAGVKVRYEFWRLTPYTLIRGLR